MPRDTKEPQSYGSGQDWVTGKTGQEVNEQASTPPAVHRDFYESSREAETVPDQGGRTSDIQAAESAENDRPPAGATGTFDTASRVTVKEGGAKRGSYFRKRDYE